MTAPTIKAVEVIHDGWGRFLRATVAMPDGSEITREIEDHGSAAVVLPYDPERRVALLVRQLRAPLLLAAGLPDLLEAPAGSLDEADPAACVRREAMEEAGVRLGAVEPLGEIVTMPGISTERIHLFLAPYGAADRVGPGGGLASETESMTVEEVSLAELAAMADGGRLPDMKTLLLVQTLRLRRPDLFDAGAARDAPFAPRSS